MSLLHVFGCLCYAHNKPRQKEKFGSRSRKFVFLGYPFGKKGWKVYDLETKEVFVSRDVRFLEDVFPFAGASDEVLGDNGPPGQADLDFGFFSVPETPPPCHLLHPCPPLLSLRQTGGVPRS